MNIHNMIDKKMKEYMSRLFKAKTELKTLQKEKDPQLRVLKGMGTLPELKERVINYRQMIDDLSEIQKCLDKQK